jgi:predicted 2-oxoglutarate/Fe(II)-dependent dioxygenase YbiX
MNSLEDYIRIYPVLEKEFCEKIQEELKTATWKQHEFYNPQTGKYAPQSGNKELDVSWDDIPSRAELTQKVWETIHKYILGDLKKPYYDSWSGFTHIRFNRYYPDRLMALHCDHIHSLFDGERKGIPTLTILGSLNNDYEGGELLLFDEEKEYKIKQGEIMMFPSVFLYPHRVAPVTKGVRDTFVAWVW